jgi:3-oxoacyl-[acyl-carrier protein] reductase
MPFTLGLRGQRALVTASSRGIGFAVAEGFLSEGARVVVNSHNQRNLTEAVGRLETRGEVHGVLADLRSQEDTDKLVTEAVKTLGGIDTFVYVTGTPRPGTFMEQEFADWKDAATLLVVSPSHLARRVADVMVKDKIQGRMVFSASIAIREPLPNIALSNVCRISIAGLVRTLARELGPKQIRVNGVLPGYILTGRVEQILSDTAIRKGISHDQALADLVGEIPLGRIGSPDELARAILFLSSEASSYVSGAMLPVDGAWLRSVG